MPDEEQNWRLEFRYRRNRKRTPVNIRGFNIFSDDKLNYSTPFRTHSDENHVRNKLETLPVAIWPHAKRITYNRTGCLKNSCEALLTSLVHGWTLYRIRETRVPQARVVLYIGEPFPLVASRPPTLYCCNNNQNSIHVSLQ